MSKMGMTLEFELGITGGEEDGIDHSGVASERLYTQPEDVAYAYEALMQISDRFTVAASFGNVHGVYAPGNVQLRPLGSVVFLMRRDLFYEAFGFQNER
jgi:fructose-bisphosphate aldolase class II